jgi:hypothetical protein
MDINDPMNSLRHSYPLSFLQHTHMCNTLGITDIDTGPKVREHRGWKPLGEADVAWGWWTGRPR